MNRFDFYPGDYQRDTADLTILEDGIYRRLLDWYYSNEGPIPDDRAEIIVRAFSDDERKKTRWILSRFFTEEKPTGLSSGSCSLWRSVRCDKEIEKARKRICAARENGLKGGRPKKSDTCEDEKPTGLNLGSVSHNPNHNPEKSSPSPSPSPSPSSLANIQETNGHVARRKAAPPKTDGSLVWNSYSEAYRAIYGTEPARNAKTNALCKRLCDLLPAEEAPLVAEYYLTTRANPYAQSGHCLDLLVRDAQKMHTEWKTGQRVTQSQAREGDRLQGMGDLWKKVIAERGEP